MQLLSFVVSCGPSGLHTESDLAGGLGEGTRVMSKTRYGVRLSTLPAYVSGHELHFARGKWLQSLLIVVERRGSPPPFAANRWQVRQAHRAVA